MSAAWPPPTPNQRVDSSDQQPTASAWFGTPDDRIDVVEPVSDDRPPAGRSALLPVLVSILTVVSIGTLAIVLAGRSSGEPELDGTNFSFALATSGDDLATSLTIEARQDIDGSWFEFDYRVDRPSLRLEATFEGHGDRLEDWGLAEGDPTVFLVDERTATTYTSAHSWFGAREPDLEFTQAVEGYRWVSMTTDWWADSSIIEEAFTEAIAFDQVFDAEAPIDRGFDRIDGEWVRRYEVVFVVEELLRDDPWALSGYEGTGLDQLDSFDYTVWVTESNQIRRTALDVRDQGVDVVVTADVELSDEPIDIDLPDAGDVISSDEVYDQLAEELWSRQDGDASQDIESLND